MAQTVAARVVAIGNYYWAAASDATPKTEASEAPQAPEAAATIESKSSLSSCAPNICPPSSEVPVASSNAHIQQQPPLSASAPPSHSKPEPQPDAANSLRRDYNYGLTPGTASAAGNMSPILTVGSSEPQPGPEPVLDPISRQILERTQSQSKLPASSQGGVPSKSPYADSGYSDSGSLKAEPVSLRRVNSSNSGKEKKKGVSFLSRIMGNKKRDSFDLHDDNASEVGSEFRPAGVEAEVFSQPVGFIPKFPAPPRYIKVKAQYRKQKDFDRLFLAQILLGMPPSKSRKPEIDSKIHSINDTPGDVVPPLPRNSANNAIWAMEFSKDGRYLAAAGQDRKLRVWEVISSADDREMEEKLAETDNDGEKVKLNAPVFKSKLIREYDGHTSSILDLSWSKNNFLLSSSMDKTVRLYHVSRAECLCAFKHNDFVTSIQFHPRDDRFFLAGSLDSKIRLWSIPDKNVAYWTQVSDMVTAVAFTPDGKTAIAGCLNGLCTLYDTEGLKAHSQIHVRSARGKNAKGSKITGIDTISVPREGSQPDVKLLITSNDSRVRMYNLKDRTLEVKFRGNENSCSQIHASFSDDGKYVICGSEDRKVYIWPTSVNERPENDKRPMEVFEAHSAIVTTAIMAPEKARRILAQSGDPLYDLCNPPPVTLVSRADSVISSRAPTNNSNHSDDKHNKDEARPSESPRRAPETPAYLSRHSHPGGQIIVTADYTGQIKVFRQDCAFQKRRHESWDSSSNFSRKMLGRSGSVATRNSVNSSTHRNSFVMNPKTQSTDRILSWRNSVSPNDTANNNASTSMVDIRSQLANNERSRSASPRKILGHRLSLHRSAPPRKDTVTSPRSPEYHSPLQQIQNGPSIKVQSPLAESPGSFHSATQKTPDQELLSPQVSLKPLPSNPTPGDLPHSPNDPLFLVDQQSYLAWDMRSTLLPMAKHMPRTPGLLGADGNPLSRAPSYMSQLSSELTGSERDPSPGGSMGDDERRASAADNKNRKSRSRRRSSVGSDSDLKCKKCGGTTFKATMTDKGQSFRCKKCGTAV
ncbi:WD domain-containing protein [Cladophialophora immunda]|nr:WD domain-containing protein [Cladophialophora immunda]